MSQEVEAIKEHLVMALGLLGKLVGQEENKNFSSATAALNKYRIDKLSMRLNEFSDRLGVLEHKIDKLKAL